MKTIFFGLLFVLFSSMSYGQQDAQYTQYMYNTNLINPAYAGSRETLNVFGLYRAQWVGFDGAPVTSNFSVDFLASDNLGIGISVLNDKIGPSVENTLNADFAYSIDVSDEYKLGFGLKATANLLDVDFGKLKLQGNNDPIFETNIDNKFSPNVGVGLFLRSEKSYVGISVPSLLETKHYDKSAGSGANSHIATEKMNYYLIAGHVFDLNDNLKFKPSILTKYVAGAPLQLDLSGNFLVNEKFTAGLAYRYDAAVSALLGFQVSNEWFIGYAYDMETSAIAKNSSGSHEVFLRFELFGKEKTVISPRFF
jgi:type IX secretion system PorP/SprF family membrane protein